MNTKSLNFDFRGPLIVWSNKLSDILNIHYILNYTNTNIWTVVYLLLIIETNNKLDA